MDMNFLNALIVHQLFIAQNTFEASIFRKYLLHLLSVVFLFNFLN